MLFYMLSYLGATKGSLRNKFTNSKEMISMSCWFVTNALVLYPIEIKLEKMIVFSN
jgi:hypothetical protein